MNAANTTFDLYHGVNAPPAAPDAAGLTGHLRGVFRGGLVSGEGDERFRFTDVLEVPLETDVRDAYPATGPDWVYVPDKDGQAYRVVFVERVRHERGRSFKRVYLHREDMAMGVTVRKNGGANVGTRQRLNLVEGANVTLTVADDGTDNEIDVTIAAEGVTGTGATGELALWTGTATIGLGGIGSGSNGAVLARHPSTGAIAWYDPALLVTPFTDEAAQDAVGAMAQNSARVTLTYADATPSLTADLVADAITAGYLHASATDVLFGRSASGAGAGEEIACTAAGRALLDDADAAAQRTTLGLGSLAVLSGVTPQTFTAITGKFTHSTTQTLAGTAFTAVACDTDTWDPSGLHDTSTNNSRITVPTGMAGRWLLIGTVLTPSLSGMTELGWAMNGTYIAGGVVSTANVSNLYTAVAVANAAVGDYFQLLCLNLNASSRTLPQGAAYPFLVAIYLGA